MDKNGEVYSVLVDRSRISLDNSFGTFEVPIVRLENGKVQYPNSDSPFNKLKFRCQWDRYEQNPTYAHRLDYREIYSIDYEDAERMFKMFKRIEKVRSGFVIQPATFGQYVALHAAGLKLESAIKVVPRDDGDHYHSWAISEAAWLIDGLITEVRPAPVKETA